MSEVVAVELFVPPTILYYTLTCH